MEIAAAAAPTKTTATCCCRHTTHIPCEMYIYWDYFFLIVCDAHKHLPLFSSILTAWYGWCWPSPIVIYKRSRSSSAKFRANQHANDLLLGYSTAKQSKHQFRCDIDKMISNQIKSIINCHLYYPDSHSRELKFRLGRKKTHLELLVW